MEKNNKFLETDIPYDKLERFGLTEEMKDDLPKLVTDRLLNGKWTPIMPLQIEGEDGKTYSTSGRLRLVKLFDEVEVIVSGKIETNELENFSIEQQNLLRGGFPVEILSSNGRREYAQLDDKTNRIAKVDADLIDKNLNTFYEALEVEEGDKLKNVTDRVTINAGSDEITYGVDLFANGSVRIVVGNKLTWAKEKENELSEYNFGLYGCWLNNQDGELASYIKEEDYTDEMYEEERKVGERNAEEMRTSGFHR